MTSPYDLSGPNSANEILSFIVAVNNMTDGILAHMILVAVFIIFFVMFKIYPTKTAFFGASTITVLSAMLMFLMHLIPQNTLIGAAIIFAVSIVILWT